MVRQLRQQTIPLCNRHVIDKRRSVAELARRCLLRLFFARLQVSKEVDGGRRPALIQVDRSKVPDGSASEPWRENDPALVVVGSDARVGPLAGQVRVAKNAIQANIVNNIAVTQAGNAPSQFNQPASWETAYNFYTQEAGFSADKALGRDRNATVVSIKRTNA